MTTQTEELRFLVDANAGRLVKWLRALGYDTEFAGDAEDAAIVQRALREGRILVTKDRRLLERKIIATGQVRAAAITADRLEEQLREFTGLVLLSRQASFTRCIQCNAVLEQASKESLKEMLPPYVYQTQQLFARCPVCLKAYWPGTHWAHMRRVLEAAFE